MSEQFINYEIANALAALALATRSYTVLDRIANAIAVDAIDKGIYELGRSLDVILRNPREGQKIMENQGQIIIEGEWKGIRTFILRGKLPNEWNYREFLSQAIRDIRIARHTAAYAAGLVASKVSEAVKGGSE